MKITKEDWLQNYKGKKFLKHGEIYVIKNAFVQTKTKFNLFKKNTEYFKLSKVVYANILTGAEYEWKGIYLYDIISVNLPKWINEFRIVEGYFNNLKKWV